MASFIVDYLSKFSPPPVVTKEEYDGWQYRWGIFVFRPAELKLEACLVLAILAYVLAIYVGVSVNSKRAKKWLEHHLPIYEQQFSKPQFKGGLTEDGYSDFFNFSTGRRNVASLHTIFTMRPRHDPLQYLFQLGRTFVDLQYRPVDEIQLDFKLAPNALVDNFVWAVVAKDELVSVKANRWDLTFTKATENAALPSQLSIVMSEFADITDNLLKPLGNFNLINVLSDPRIQPYFRSLSITDQPRDRPETPIPPEHREKHVILSLIAPPISNAADTVPLVNATFQLIDSLSKINLRPETKIKLKKMREEVDKEMKEEAEREKKEDALDAKAAAKRRAKEEHMAKLSAADQQKELEKERKRNLRKTQGEVVRK